MKFTLSVSLAVVLEGTVVMHGHTTELPASTTAAAHYGETALPHSKHPIQAGVLGQLVIHLSCSPYYHLYS